MIIKITPDKEKAQSMVEMAENRLKFLSEPIDFPPTIKSENYYEIIKELLSAFLLIKGLKTIGEYAHKELIEEAGKFNLLEDFELAIIDDLRIKRNKSSYEGKEIEKEYINNNEERLKLIIENLKKIINKELNELK